MRTQKEIVELLQSVEALIRKEISTAGEKGEYDRVLLMSQLAKDLAPLCNKAEYIFGAPSHATSDTEAQSLAIGHDIDQPMNRHAKVIRSKKLRGGMKAYPRFRVVGKDLVKIGWSKSEKAEYVHRAPVNLALIILRTISRDAATAGIVQTSTIIDSVLNNAGAETPPYQIYVCLAWLRHENLVAQQGRQGYSISVPIADVESAFDSAKKHSMNK